MSICRLDSRLRELKNISLHGLSWGSPLQDPRRTRREVPLWLSTLLASHHRDRTATLLLHRVSNIDTAGKRKYLGVFEVLAGGGQRCKAIGPQILKRSHQRSRAEKGAVAHVILDDAPFYVAIFPPPSKLGERSAQTRAAADIKETSRP